PMVAVPDGANFVTRPEVTGLVRAHHRLEWAGPDGNTTTLNDTDISSFQGISGLVHPATLPLVGVFLTDDLPEESGTPARLDFYDLGSSFASLAPEIGQSFFIGDGWTDGGVLQEFMVPAGATRFFLGFADASYFTGAPGAYADNDGAFVADVRFNIVPAPGSMALLGFGALVCGRRRR
ncbi:MAG: PEP-CTERM sorting domain-containing protein, partial [Phycisphaerales bacterium JB041]